MSANPEAINDHFAKLGSIYARLNILSKPMQIYNIDECGVSIVHKGGKVITDIGRKNVWAISSGRIAIAVLYWKRSSSATVALSPVSPSSAQ